MPQPPVEETPKPKEEHNWQSGLPEDHGMDPAVFEQLDQLLPNSPVEGMLTVKDGVIIHEYYEEGADETTVFSLNSCSKSFTSALVGIALERGEIGSVDDPLSDYLPQLLQLEDTGKQAVTLRHLLTQTSGLEWYEWGGGYSNWNEFRSSPDWVEYILGRSLVSEPGKVFNYSTGNTHLLAAALEQAVGMSTLEYGRLHLFEPLGIKSIQWDKGPEGVTDGGNGVSMTLRDAARFGQLFLQQGVWQGEQLIPADWAKESTAVQNPGPGGSTGQYGYQWWVRPFGDYETYYAFGAFGQYILVTPELGLVTVIASDSYRDSYAPRAYFTDYVLAAAGYEKPEGSPQAQTLRITVGDEVFTAALYDNPSAHALLECLPLTLLMEELNGNEKFHYLSEPLPSAAEAVGSVQAGDLMLYGDDCIVLFYESFETPYRYTPLGSLANADGLAKALGSGGIQVTFEIE